MFEVSVSGVDRKRRTLEVDVDAVESILADDACNRRYVIWNAVRISKREVLTAAAQRNHHLLALGLQVSDISLKLCGIESGRCMELHGPFRRVLVWGRKRDNDHVPLGRHLEQRKR